MHGLIWTFHQGSPWGVEERCPLVVGRQYADLPVGLDCLVQKKYQKPLPIEHPILGHSLGSHLPDYNHQSVTSTMLCLLWQSDSVLSAHSITVITNTGPIVYYVVHVVLRMLTILIKSQSWYLFSNHK